MKNGWQHNIGKVRALDHREDPPSPFPSLTAEVQTMVPLQVLLSLLVFTAGAEAGTFIFPGQLDHAEGDACRTNTGGSGTCSRTCEHSPSLGEPRKCGIKDSRFLLCCDANPGNDPRLVQDIASPRVAFQCGINKKNEFVLKFSFTDEGDKIYVEPQDINPVKKHNETIRLENGTEVVQEFAVAGVGAERAERNAWPWMALIGERDGGVINWFCGGVLLNDQWVLSAQHCFYNHNAEVVRLGEHNYKDDNDGAAHEDFAVVEMVPYPDHRRPEAYHDLALLRLASRVTLKKFISPICLAWGLESEVDITDQKATLTGYGDTQFGGYPTSYLQELNVTVFPPAQCDSSYSTLPHYTRNWPQGIGQETLCAGDPAGGRDACQGDSGGPLMSLDTRGYFVLAGIVSRGYGCGHKDYPGLYANLRHPPYLDWIKKVAFAMP
ncbi:clotting factor G beta subunit-like [Eriocheir sinensis]|uniref:clotting factor G beta subunit-like n=1 Tax=Eriocheir sinensis TaxID=95602 RepID=UPI0021C85DA3|nr:clotting factor G beta subunit-like [Eriocheir sinensis]